MVTDLLKSNKQLRDSINTLNKEKENIENDNCILQSDNLELRDRIEILESIIKANANDYENYDWKKIIEEETDAGLAAFKSSSNKGVENVASTIVETKKENRMLKRRVEHLEVQISQLTNYFDYQGNIEPTRANMGQRDDPYFQNNQTEYMPEQSPLTYYDNNNFGAGMNLDYSNAPNSQNMRSTGFNRGRPKLNSKSSLRDGGGAKRLGRKEMLLRNNTGHKKKVTKHHSNVDYTHQPGMGMLDEPLPPAIPQGQGSHPNPNMMVVNVGNGKAPLKDKDEALKMLYSMMMNRVQKKRHGNP